MNKQKIILTGGAGLVGQNLIIYLKKKGYSNLVVIDKHKKNLSILKKLHPDIIAKYADLSKKGQWEDLFEKADVVVMLQAQIGGISIKPFVRNNLLSTMLILQNIKKYNVPYTVGISSSVVNSVADDFYTKTKKKQEELIIKSKINHIILRPTLMFGLFDRKHLGWLSRFMKKIFIFPIPGHGNYIRQPLYAGDFCNIIISCIERKNTGVYNISGIEQVAYIDIIRQIKKTIKAKCIIMKIPYILFYVLLKIWAIFDKNPPFTSEQLTALTAGDKFEVIDWQQIFSTKATPFVKAIDETFNDSIYSNIVLKF